MHEAAGLIHASRDHPLEDPSVDSTQRTRFQRAQSGYSSMVRARSDNVRADHLRRFVTAPSSVREVRKFVVDSVAGTGVDEFAAELLASELATNAVVHARTDFDVHVFSWPMVVRVEFTNDAPEMPFAMKKASEEGGRGMRLLAELSSHWGTRTSRDTKMVWFELDRP